jgi:hypothetical protein
MRPTAAPAAWDRLGQLLTRRRVDLDPRYKNRTIFSTERGIDYRLAYDIEEGRRRNFRSSTLGGIAAAYAVTLDSVYAVLDDSGQLEPVPGGPPGQARVVAPSSRDDRAVALFPHDPAKQQAWRTLADPSMDTDEKLGRIAGAYLWPDDEAQQKILVAAVVSRVTADEMAEMMQVLPRKRAENRARLLNPGGEVSA